MAHDEAGQWKKPFATNITTETFFIEAIEPQNSPILFGSCEKVVRDEEAIRQVIQVVTFLSPSWRSPTSFERVTDHHLKTLPGG